MDAHNVDLLVQYALAVAGQEDFGHHELGPIHLVKYVYLGDLAYAERHVGQTFTGAPWRFYKFGPWAEPVFARIEPVAHGLGAEERRVSSTQGEEAVRWYLDDARLLDRLDAVLPLEVTSAIRHAVHAFGADTTGLLHHVYRTAPMLHAAPDELLDFTVAETPTPPSRTVAPTPAPSKRSRKEAMAALAAVRERVQARLRERAAARRVVAPEPPPRYDAVFQEGQAWLDALAGAPAKLSQGTVTFSDDIWKSRGRRDPGIP